MSLTSSISLRLTISVNSILRISREVSTCAAHHLPAARGGTCACPCAASSSSFSSNFSTAEPRLADGFDLLEELLRPLLDAVVGDLFVVEDDQLADRAVAGAQRVAHADDGLGDRRHARDRLDDRELALLDALGDGDLALAGEQRHRAHLAQVHADGIVGLVERAGREVELGTLRRPRAPSRRARRYDFSESTRSMPAAPNAANSSSRSSGDAVRSAGSRSLTSSYSR